MRKRNCRVEVCFTKDELTVLSKKAKKAGLSIGGFVRHSVADKEIKEAPPADIPLLLRAMRQAGYNLDQTLKRFNTTNVPDMPQFRKGLEEIRAATKMVSDAYTSDYQKWRLHRSGPLKDGWTRLSITPAIRRKRMTRKSSRSFMKSKAWWNMPPTK